MSSEDQDRYAIVFSGGGALGAWEIGCMEEILRAKGCLPRVVTGASAGALNAAGICAGLSSDELKQIWQDLKSTDVYKHRLDTMEVFARSVRLLWKRFVGSKSAATALGEVIQDLDSIFDTTPLRYTLQRILRPVSDRFFSSQIDFAASLTDLRSRSRVIAYKPGPRCPQRLLKEGRPIDNLDVLISTLMGTSAIPILFPPYRDLFDGGVLRNHPVAAALLFEVTEVYVLIPASQQPNLSRTLSGIMDALLATWISSSLYWQVDLIRVRNEVRALAGLALIKPCFISPQRALSETLGVGMLSFGINVSGLIEQGAQDARNRLAKFDLSASDTWYTGPQS